MADTQTVIEITPPKGGRVHVVRVPVNPARDWQEAINAAGPDTPQNYNVRKVGDQYPPQLAEVAEEEIILVNFGRYIDDIQVAVDWGKEQKLRPEDPRGTFAVGEHKPRLHRELGLSVMAIVSPQECSFEGRRFVCRVWLFGALRYCYLRWYGLGFLDYFWFAFVREDEPLAD
ncbi:MAG: hypothetical protein Q7S26_01505 [bacterium]|nr:hypothetical protein [bacterium]